MSNNVFPHSWREEYQGALLLVARRMISPARPLLFLIETRPGKINLKFPPLATRDKVRVQIIYEKPPIPPGDPNLRPDNLRRP
jgi:hypothetical protein